MDYLFKVSLKKKGVPLCYSHSKAKPVYIVKRDKEAVMAWAKTGINSSLEVRSVSCMAKQVAGTIFSGDM